MFRKSSLAVLLASTLASSSAFSVRPAGFAGSMAHPSFSQSTSPVSGRVFMGTSVEERAEVSKKEGNADGDSAKALAAIDASDDECVIPEEEELSESAKLLKKVKESGTAGIISYALWELGFWAISVPICSFGFYEATGHWPNFGDKEDLAKLGAEAFAFVNFARLAVPLRIGLALGTTPWIKENIVDKYIDKDKDPKCEPADDQ